MVNTAGIVVKSTPWKIKALAQLKREGRLRLPDLQRGFVWSPDRVRYLHDSLYRRYPIGALLLWKPSWEGSESPFLTRAWDLFPPNPTTDRGEPERDTSVSPGSIFVLDGQQRLTSLFRVIFSSRLGGKATRDPNLLVALSPDEEWAREPFRLWSRSLFRQMRNGLLIDADVLFAGFRGEDESLAVQKAIANWVQVTDGLFFKALDRANAIRNTILEAEIVAYEIDAEAEDDSVIEIFARLNQQGVRLKPGDLAAARLTGRMRDFRERARRCLSDPDLKGFATREGEDDAPRGGAMIDTDLLVRTALFLGNNVLRYKDIEERKVNPAGADAYSKVGGQWDAAVGALKRVVAVLKSHGVCNGTWIPYRYVLLPPAISFANYKDQDGSFWIGWAIIASIWGLYSGSADTKAQSDAIASRDDNRNRLLDNVRGHAKRTESLLPDEEDFINQIVQVDGVLLALLVDFVTRSARSLPDGRFFQPTPVESIEIHHIFPRARLNRGATMESQHSPDRIGNLTLLYRTDNEHLSDELPESYLQECSLEALREHMIPEDQELWRIENYATFCEQREKQLAVRVGALLQTFGIT